MVSCDMAVFHSASRHDLDESWCTRTLDGLTTVDFDLAARGMRWMSRGPWEADTLLSVGLPFPELFLIPRTFPLPPLLLVDVFFRVVGGLGRNPVLTCQ